MLKKIILSLLLIMSPMLAKTLTLSTKEEQIIKDIGVKVIEITSIAQGYVENSNFPSTILLGKIMISSDTNMKNIYDPWEESYARDDHRKLTKISVDVKPKYAIVIITNNDVNILIERKNGYELSAQYPFQIKLKSISTVKNKLPKNINYKSIIAIPDGSGMDTYLLWNGKKYINIWNRDEDGDQG
jgi:hypothetical protein